MHAPFIKVIPHQTFALFTVIKLACFYPFCGQLQPVIVFVRQNFEWESYHSLYIINSVTKIKVLTYLSITAT